MPETEILLTFIVNKQLFVDPKRIILLKEIDQCGSISQAAKNAKISYKSAWDHLNTMNLISPKPLLQRNNGGKNGGGTLLTHYAKRLLRLYALLQLNQQKAFNVLQDEKISLENALAATAKFSIQTSARNQFFGSVKKISNQGMIEVAINGLEQSLFVQITTQSTTNLQLHLDKEVMLLIKAPWVLLSQKRMPDKVNQFNGKITLITHNEMVIENGNGITFYAAIETMSYKEGQQIVVHIDPANIILAALTQNER